VFIERLNPLADSKILLLIKVMIIMVMRFKTVK